MMAEANVEFTFLEAPPSDSEIEEGLFTVMLDVSGCEPLIQPLVIRLMQLVQEASRERGARYTFSLR